MPYLKPLVLPAGNILSAGFINTLVANNLYLLGLVGAEHDCFIGCNNASNEQSGIGEVVGVTCFMYYGGRNTLFNRISATSGNVIRIYITDNAGRKKIYESTAAPSSTLDFTNDTSSNPLSLTLNHWYKVEVCWVVPNPGSAGVECGWLAIERPQDTNWPTLETFADNSVPTDFQLVIDAQTYLRNLAEVPYCGGVEVAMADDSPSINLEGGFYYTGQTTLNILIKSIGTVDFPTVGGYSLTIYPNSGTEGTSFGIFNSSGENQRTDTYVLGTGGGAYTVNTFYRFVINMTASGNPLWVQRVWLSNDVAFTTTPYTLNPFDEVRGSTNEPRLKPLAGNGGADNLTELAVKLRGSPTIGAKQYGIHMLATLGGVSQRGGLAGTLSFSQVFTLTHRLPVLHYLPNGVGQSGSLTYGTTTVSLPDNNGDGSWTSFLLDSQALLAYGYTYKVTGVYCCVELPSA